jgi:hypothetical protein
MRVASFIFRTTVRARSPSCRSRRATASACAMMAVRMRGSSRVSLSNVPSSP